MIVNLKLSVPEDRIDDVWYLVGQLRAVSKKDYPGYISIYNPGLKGRNNSRSQANHNQITPGSNPIGVPESLRLEL